jgi:hypothetical protein
MMMTKMIETGLFSRGFAQPPVTMSSSPVTKGLGVITKGMPSTRVPIATTNNDPRITGAVLVS